MQCQGNSGYQFTSPEPADPKNIVRLLPDNKGIFNGGITICMRAQFQFWNRRSIFNSTNIQLNLRDFKYSAGSVRIDTSFYNFKWPEQIYSFSAFHSFCVVIDTTKGYLSLSINGKNTFSKEDKNLLQNLPLADNTYFDVGTYSGNITDFYVWNNALNASQVHFIKIKHYFCHFKANFGILNTSFVTF